MDKTASVAGGNFRAIRETNEVVVAIRAKLAVEEFTGGDLERLNELSRLGAYQMLIFFREERRGSYEPYDDQIAVLDFSVFRPHLAWQLFKDRKRLP